jgi:hypothetical protein
MASHLRQMAQIVQRLRVPELIEPSSKQALAQLLAVCIRLIARFEKLFIPEENIQTFKNVVYVEGYTNIRGVERRSKRRIDQMNDLLIFLSYTPRLLQTLRYQVNYRLSSGTVFSFL